MFKLILRCSILTLLLVAGCGKTEQSSEPDTNAPATFVGSAACQSCHEAEFGDWMGSHHQLAMQVATSETVLGNFNDASLEYFGTTTRFYTRDGSFYVQTADASGKDREFRISYTFGVEPLQQYLIEFPGGRLQSLAFSWDTRPESEGGQRWFHVYGDEHIGADDYLHWTGPQQNWNYMCAECHSTNVEMGFDSASNSFATTYSEISVGCEACHGPGARHIAQVDSASEVAGYGFDVDFDDHGTANWVMNTATGIAERSEAPSHLQQQPEACGRCHSRRGIIAPSYEYGKPLVDTHMPALLEESLYFADGQIQDEVYVYGSFLQSRMYRAGVTCSDCHNPHSAKLVSGTGPNDVCAQCHLPAKFTATEHAGHTPTEAGCVDCHMASRTYMVVDDRRDHSFRVPRPDLSESNNTPNACASCHSDHDAAWATAAIKKWRGPGALSRPEFGSALYAGRHGYANPELLEVVNNSEYPGIARATAVSLLAKPFGSNDFRSLQAAVGNADSLIRIATLRQIRSLPNELKLRLGGSRLLADPVRAVRIEAVSTYAGMEDLLPIDDVRAYSPAEREFREAYESIANRPEALITLAIFEMAERNTAAAVELYQNALQIEPRAAAARVNLADALRTLSQDNQAATVLRDGLILDSANPALHHSLGLSLVRSGQPDEALTELRQAVRYAPENPRYAYVLAIALNSMGQQREALQVLLTAHEHLGGDFDIALALASILRDSGDRDAALGVAYDLARRHPAEPSVLALLRSLNAVP